MKEFYCYFDESGTHKSSPVIVMGGLVGDDAQFAQFVPRLDEIRRRYGFTIFHAVDFKNGNGEFRGWLPQKKVALTIELSNLVAETMTAGAAATLLRDDYDHAYRADTSQPKVSKDSAYGLCFRMCLVGFLGDIEEACPYMRTPYVINVTVEHGDPNVEDARRVFEEVRATVRAVQHPDPFGTFRVAKKHECPELMLADFFAYTQYLRHTQTQDESSLSKAEIAELESHASEEQKARLSYIYLEREQLSQLQEHFAKLKRRRNYAARRRQ
jgi:uncharacterized protein DUF3800